MLWPTLCQRGCVRESGESDGAHQEVLNVSTVERRRSPRFGIRVPVRVVLPHGRTLSGEVQDICRDAALVAVSEQLDVETTVLLGVTLPGFLGSFEAAGRVVRLAGPVDGGLGVVVLFTDLSPQAVTAVDLYLERLAEDGAPRV